MKSRLNTKLWAAVAGVLLLGAAAAGCFREASPGSKDTVEARLQQLEDREEILQLLRSYGQYLDRRDFASFARLFAENGGEWIGGMGRAKNPRAIRKLMEDTIGRDTSGRIAAPNYHLFSNEVIHVEGDRAGATTKWVFIVENEAKRPQPLYLGHYEDTFVREKGRWKFLKRVVYGDIPADDPLSRQ